VRVGAFLFAVHEDDVSDIGLSGDLPSRNTAADRVYDAAVMLRLRPSPPSPLPVDLTVIYWKPAPLRRPVGFLVDSCLTLAALDFPDKPALPRLPRTASVFIDAIFNGNADEAVVLRLKRGMFRLDRSLRRQLRLARIVAEDGHAYCNA
jgi:hypothetical protein